MSHLVAAGHADAADYPLARVMDELVFVGERERQEQATSAVMLHAAAAAVLTKDGLQHFKKTLERLESGD